MKSTRAVLILLALVGAITLAILPGLAQSPTKELRVKVTYSGPGSVDATHGIHLYVFDTPDIGAGSMPIAADSIYENGGEFVFGSVTQPTVYLAAAYGDYDAMMGPPPSGTPVALYKPGDMNMPTPIKMDTDKVQVEFKFDDSMKMP